MSTPTPAEMVAQIDTKIAAIIAGTATGTAGDIAKLKDLRAVYQALLDSEPYESVDEIALDYDEFGKDRSDTGQVP